MTIEGAAPENIVRVGKHLYDITGFIPEHPGGARLLENISNCSGSDSVPDVSSWFFLYHINQDAALRALSRLKVVTADGGQSEEAPGVIVPDDGQKYAELRGRVRRFLREHRISSKHDCVRTSVVALLYLAVCILKVDSLLKILVHGLLLGHLVWNSCHDFTHGHEARPGTLLWCHRLFARIVTFNFHRIWMVEHNLHHIHTNTLDDPDLHLFSPSVYFYASTRALSCRHKLKRIIQYMLAIVYMAHLTYRVAKACERAAKSRSGNKSTNIGIPWCSMAFHGALLSQGGLHYLASLCVANAFVFFTEVPGHLAQARPAKGHNNDLVLAQIRNTINFYGLPSWLCCGIDYQIEHHLFPSIANSKMAAIAPLVQQWCADHGIEYRRESIWSLWGEHLKYHF